MSTAGQAVVDRLRTSQKPASMATLVQTIDHLVEAIKARDAHIKALASRIAGLEARRTMAFEGPFDPGRQYRAGDCVQRTGGLFVALANTSEQPGSSGQWRSIGDAR